MVIDPHKLTHPVPVEEREYWALFFLCLNGKTSKVQAEKINEIFALWEEMWVGWKPFSLIRNLEESEVEDLLRSVGMGQYERLVKSWTTIACYGLNHEHELFARLPGVGSKTSRMLSGYLNNEKVAILDVHVLAWLRGLGQDHIPTQTPYNEGIYQVYEKIYLSYAEKLGVHPLDLDTAIWRASASSVTEGEGT
jgi:hypothetical protein